MEEQSVVADLDLVDEKCTTELRHVCRACMAENVELQSIFVRDESSGVDIHLAEMIMTYANVQITLGDGLSEEICLTCAKKVAELYLFKRQCEQTDAILRNKIEDFPRQDQDYDEKTVPGLGTYEMFKDDDLSEVIVIKSENADYFVGDSNDNLNNDFNDNDDPDDTDFQNDDSDFVLSSSEKSDSKAKSKSNSDSSGREDYGNIEPRRRKQRSNVRIVDAKLYQCVLCNVDLETENNFNQHMVEEHKVVNADGSKKCPVCSKTFSKNFRLNRHLRSHAPVKPYVCIECNKGFTRAEQLNNHMNHHTGVKPHVCNICGKGFNQISNLKDHIRTHNGEKPFLCSTCGKGFNQLGNLRQHTIRHSGIKAHLCNICGSGFASKGELGAHLRKHTGARPFVCPICNHGFTTSSSLTKHKRIHSGEKPYECEVCHMKFSRSGILARHKRTHTGEKPYICNYCAKAFSQSNDLNSHLRIHTGEKPYICDTCGQAFRQSSALKTHKRIHDKAKLHGIKMELVQTTAPATTVASSTEPLKITTVTAPVSIMNMLSPGL